MGVTIGKFTVYLIALGGGSAALVLAWAKDPRRRE